MNSRNDKELNSIRLSLKKDYSKLLSKGIISGNGTKKFSLKRAIKVRLLRQNVEYTNGLLYSKNEIDRLKQQEKEIRFIDDLEKDEDDKSIEFGKEFFEKVNISANSREYNEELITYLTFLREALLNNDGEEEFLNLQQFLSKSTPYDGASIEFLTSDLVEKSNSYRKRKRQNLH